jgi:hypothetical protein
MNWWRRSTRSPMTPNRHRIQRQVIELSLGGGLASPAVQESMAHAFHEEWIPALMAVFDRTADADHLLRLDRLEIDLGTVVASDWQPELRRLLGVELEQQLARFVPESIHPPAARRDTPANEPWRQFRFFLEQGRLPWWGERLASGWQKSLTSATIEWPALYAIVRDRVAARTRLIEALDDNLLELAVGKWGGVPNAAAALHWIASRHGALQAGREWRHRAWRVILDAALEPGALLSRGSEILLELLELHPAAKADDSKVEPAPDGGAMLGGGSARTVPQPEKLPPPWRGWFLDAAVSAAGSAAGRERSARGSPGSDRHTSPAASQEGRRPATTGPAPDEDSIYLPGAGAIVLHPFLEPLFRDRGLLKGREFRDDAARERAVHLVGLLSFGTRAVPEYDLVAAKLLCGHPLDAPLAPVELDDADATACEELLAAVLRHWSALRSSSADWLRAQFFLRDGKLEQIDEGFRLTVERRAQDVLLGRLPWGLGVIGFPWLKEKIFVRWLD